MVLCGLSAVRCLLCSGEWHVLCAVYQVLCANALKQMCDVVWGEWHVAQCTS